MAPLMNHGELSQEIQDTFQGVWVHFLKLQPSATTLEQSMPFAMIQCISKVIAAQVLVTLPQQH